ncbi:MAG TPA: hypothetical protein VFC19_27110 [Candidatus Limnocylindrales bacterium]|nr:hypothetical protein [Candidatus Limnocylindrales bacterium]
MTTRRPAPADDQRVVDGERYFADQVAGQQDGAARARSGTAAWSGSTGCRLRPARRPAGRRAFLGRLLDWIVCNVTAVGLV